MSITNRNAVSVQVRLAVSSAAAPTAGEWLFYDYILAGNQTIERTGLVADAGKLVVAYASLANVSVVAYGLED